MTKAETIFAYELSLIHDKDIKQFVITCFDKLCPDYFWTCPCSTTGKYHPQVSLGVGGLVRHTKLAVWWGIELLEALGPSPELNRIPTTPLRDEVIATLLLHDMIKNGKSLNAQGYPFDRGVTGTHGVMLAKKIIRSDLSIDDPNNRIIVGIAGHMGIWTTDDYFRPDNIINPTQKAFAQLIHLADYCASRKVDDIYHRLKKPKYENKLLDGVGTLPPGVLKISITEKEKTNDIIKKCTPTNTSTNKKTSKSPPCPGIRSVKDIYYDYKD